MSLTIQRIGGPTAVLGYAGLRFLTDPTFDAPRAFDSSGVTLTKLAPPALGPDDVGDVDVVLLSHDHHPDNLDEAGRAFLPRAGRVLTTVKGAERLGGGAEGLEPWQSVELGDGGERVTVTALPALHGPEGSDPYTGPVIGFLLAADGEPRVYVSGDNASLDVVREIVERVGPVDVAVLFAGRASIPERFDGAPLTLTATDAAEAARLLGARTIVPVHCEGWAHFADDETATRAAFASAGLEDRLVAPEPGASATI